MPGSGSIRWAYLACFGMHAEGGLEEMVPLLGHLHVELGVGEAEDDLILALG